MKLVERKVTFQQEMDCCGTGDDQYIEIESCDGGGGHYIVINTERWAIDMDEKGVEEFLSMLRQVLVQS